jgi:NADPH:quinone reductase-like Zn-dependent oxidoreductase
MRSLRFTKFGPPSVLRIEEVAIPEPRDGEALIQVKAAAINPSDIADVSGRFKNTTLPRTPGRDFAGPVVTGKRHQGEEVLGSAPNLGIVRDGSHAEYVVRCEWLKTLENVASNLGTQTQITQFQRYEAILRFNDIGALHH